MSQKFHYIYDAEFSRWKWNIKFTSLWQHKAKLQSKIQTKTVIGVLLTHQYSQPSLLPETLDPLPRFTEPWNSQPETSSRKETLENPIAAPPEDMLKEFPHPQPDAQWINVDTTTRVYWFGKATRNHCTSYKNTPVTSKFQPFYRHFPHSTRMRR